MLGRWLGACAVIFALFGIEGTSNARLDPYYLLKGTSFGQVRPRILFVLDTSGSMVWQPNATGCPAAMKNRWGECDCTWMDCEGTVQEKASRIRGARMAIQRVVNLTRDEAGFGLMTFGQLTPPVSSAQVPARCGNGQRFEYVTWVNAYASKQNAYGPWGMAEPPGQWALCGENRPYPYIRREEAGFDLSRLDVNNLPYGPLAKDFATPAIYRDALRFVNRRVQWLPRFMGVHFRGDCADPVMGPAISASLGDYATSELCGQDFLYVPYVDGWSGYTAMRGRVEERRDIRMGMHARDFNLGGQCLSWVDSCCENKCRTDNNYTTCVNGCATTPPASGEGNACNTGFDCPGTATECVGYKCHDGSVDDPCDSGYNCMSGRCVSYICRRGVEGDPCDSGYDCNSGRCVSFICRAGVNGDPCNSGYDCDSGRCVGYTCRAGVECDPCDSGANCDSGHCVGYQCRLGYQGDPCGSGYDCEAGLACTNYVCGGGAQNACVAPPSPPPPPPPSGVTPCEQSCNGAVARCVDQCIATGGTNSCPRCDDYRSGTDNGMLLAPFFSQGAINTFSGQDEGPPTMAAANDLVYQLSDAMHRGGIDAESGTPWATAVGDPSLVVPPQSNKPFSHTTIASYVKLMRTLNDATVCSPIVAVLITDGDPSPADTEGGSRLHERLSRLRNELGVRTYVVGFALDSTSLNNMACAAAGSTSYATPCTGMPVKQWDTCDDPANPTTRCAYTADSADRLARVLTTIVKGELKVDVPSGQGSTVNEYVVDSTTPNRRVGIQTGVRGFTEYPEWHGHVLREGNCQGPQCASAVTDEQETFSMCTGTTCLCDDFSRSWDAGDCLSESAWERRRLYTHDENRRLVRITDGSGVATGAFRALVLDPRHGHPIASLPVADQAAAVQKLAEFIQGKDWSWKLPGLANSVPVVVRRIPMSKPDIIQPSVGIRDPHCTGRQLGTTQLPEEVDAGLVQFAKAAWADPRAAGSFRNTREYQEAVLVGDDLGVLHAFQLDSGNELFGLMPRQALQSAYEQSLIGGQALGQSDDLREHRYGVGGTVNHGWVYDATAPNRWRHLAIVGMGKGGKDYMALDVSHMGRLATDEPVDILWTTEDDRAVTGPSGGAATLREFYDRNLGETWSRPALAYDPPSDRISDRPKSYLLFGSGYPDATPTTALQGRTLIMADALTGQPVEWVDIPVPSQPTEMYEPVYGNVTDPAVGTHCNSGYWAEMQEVYFVDPAGGLYRWDQGTPVGSSTRPHAADGGALWDPDRDGRGTAIPSVRFGACRGTGGTCDVSSAKFDSFTYSPAVVSLNRIGPASPVGEDQFLVALASGSPYDSAVDGGNPQNDFHSSLYLLVDNHKPDPRTGLGSAGGWSIPTGQPKNVVDRSYARFAVSDLTRTRVVMPYPGACRLPDPTTADPGTCPAEVRVFSKGTRPIRPPRILVTRAADPDALASGTNLDTIEIVYVEFMVYEPPSATCDPRWYDSRKGQWHVDPGETYRILFRLTTSDQQGFNFLTGSGMQFGQGDRHGFTGAALTAPRVEQVGSGNCPSGDCGALPKPPFMPPCDENIYTPAVSSSSAVALTHSELSGFVPSE